MKKVFIISVLSLTAILFFGIFTGKKYDRKEKTYTSAYVYNQKSKTFDYWKKINDDVLFILEINGKSFPVLKDKDNFYLEHDIYKNRDKYGAVFLQNDLEDNNLFIYGHSSSEKDIIFTFMKKYLNEYKKEKLKDILNFEILIDGEKIKYHVTAAKVVDLENPKEDYSFLNVLDSVENKNEHLKNFYKTADRIFKKQKLKNNKYPLITFVTCDLTKKDARYVILCKPS